MLLSSNKAVHLQSPGQISTKEAAVIGLGVAGQAVSLNGEAVRGLFVQLGGSMPGVESVDNLVMTGLAPQYGQGGFEIHPG